MNSHSPDLSFLDGPAVKLAPRLLGCVLERQLDGQSVQVRIVETEAYDQSDVASHSYKGKTPKSEVMFGQAGHLYVYFTYGMHYCCNIVVGPRDYGAAVLIRAVEPISGVDIMKRRRPTSLASLTNGPAKLCQALAIDRQLNGHDLAKPPFVLMPCPALDKRQIIISNRVGISHGQDLPWRFYINNNSFVSTL